ncbi:MAG: class I SAM-dependent methyltransferase [Pseudomonadota bacterium]|nr:class I SAM-dependent methyltransferase [Pseudomonadota bacterium]
MTTHITLNTSDAPSPWVVRWLPVAPGGEVLDLACGRGRHARLATSLHHSVVAVDRDPAALIEATGEGIVTHCVDLEGEGAVWPFDAARFAAVIVTNYLHRPLLPHLARALQPGGMLIYETFALGNEAYGKPSNPAFLLAPGELLDMARTAGLHVLAYEDGVIMSGRHARIQRLCAIAPQFQLSSTPLDM